MGSATNSSTRIPSHQLSNGLYVSGHPDQHKEKATLMSSAAMPYTGGDVKKSGELGKMFDIPVENPNAKRKSGPISAGSGKVGSAASHSGPLPAPRTAFSTSGPLSSAGIPRQNSLGSKSGLQVQGGLHVQQTGSQGSKSGPISGPPQVAGRPKSGPVGKSGDAAKVLKTSGPLPVERSKSSGPLNPPLLPATGLITSGPVSGPLSSSGVLHKTSGPMSSGQPKRVLSGPVDSSASSKNLGASIGSHAVTKLGYDGDHTFKKNFPKVILVTVIILFIMGFAVGAYFVAIVHSPILLTVVGCLFLLVAILWTWNSCWGESAVTRYVVNFPDAELSKAEDGRYVKVTGVVTCGSVPLESSYQKVNRCIYTSTGLYEYKGFMSKPANDKHKMFTWGLRSLERHVVDFYISDFQSGLRALVKAGYGATVTPYVHESTIIDVTPQNKDLPADFVRWLGERNLSSDDRIMQLREGYIKEGSTVTVLGVVQRQDNVLMIVPPPESVPTGCQIGLCLLPANMDGILLRCDEVSKADGIPL